METKKYLVKFFKVIPVETTLIMELPVEWHDYIDEDDILDATEKLLETANWEKTKDMSDKNSEDLDFTDVVEFIGESLDINWEEVKKTICFDEREDLWDDDSYESDDDWDDNENEDEDDNWDDEDEKDDEKW
jgi:hypothetical protein